MLLCMIDEDGRRRIGLVVTRWMAYQRVSATVVERDGGPSRSTFDKVKAGKEVGEEMLNAVEGRIGLPIMFLTHVGEGDARAVGRSSADPDLVRYVTELIREDKRRQREEDAAG